MSKALSLVALPSLLKRYSVLSSYPTSIRCDIEKEFITCSATLTVACSFGVGVWVYFLILSLFPHICVCVYVSQIKKIPSVVKSSHIDKVWYWEMIYHLFRDTNCCMQFWCWRVSIFSYLIPLPPYVCVCVCMFLK